MCELTREGNEVVPRVCDLRESIAWNSETICADCKHVTDSCDGVAKTTEEPLKQYVVVTTCESFDPVST